MTLQFHTNNICLPVEDGCLVSTYNDNNRSWENLKLLQSSGTPHSNGNVEVECCSFSSCGKYLAICFRKVLIIYTTGDWNLLTSTITERKGVSVKFFPKSNVILIAEKCGNVKFFKFGENVMEKIDYVLGHNSMITEALVTKDENFIITCDKDQKIRVTHYPNVHNILSYCLGHTQFVCSMNILQSYKNILISSSGDKTIRLWDYTTGKELFKYIDVGNIKNETANNTDFFIRVTSLAIGEGQSLIAAIKLKSNYVTLLRVTGDIETNLNVELCSTIEHSDNPYDIEFWQTNLVCLLQDENNPLKVYSSKDNFADSKEDFTALNCKLTGYWHFIQLTCRKRGDMFSSMFQYRKVPETPSASKFKKMKKK